MSILLGQGLFSLFFLNNFIKKFLGIKGSVFDFSLLAVFQIVYMTLSIICDSLGNSV